MKKENPKWSLFNRHTNTQLDGLDLAEVKSTLSGLFPEQLAQWKAWHEGQTKWQSVTKFAELKDLKVANFSEETAILEAIKNTAKVKKSEPRKFRSDSSSINSTPSFEMDGENLSRSKSTSDSEEFEIKRRGPRLARNYRVVIKAAHIIFECHTIDISSGGMRLNKELPKALANITLVCEISWGVTNIKLNCRAIPDPDPKAKGSTRLMVSQLNDPESLRIWLISAR